MHCQTGGKPQTVLNRSSNCFRLFHFGSFCRDSQMKSALGRSPHTSSCVNKIYSGQIIAINICCSNFLVECDGYAGTRPVCLCVCLCIVSVESVSTADRPVGTTVVQPKRASAQTQYFGQCCPIYVVLHLTQRFRMLCIRLQQL